MIRFPEPLLKDGLRRERREKALMVLAAALESADPATAVRCRLQREGSLLLVEGRAYDLSRFRRALVVGPGRGVRLCPRWGSTAAGMRHAGPRSKRTI